MSGLLTSVLPAQFRINEIDADTPGPDTGEFIEIFRLDGSGDSLAGHVLVFFDGSDPSDSVYRTIDLDSSSFDPAGFFVIGGSDFGPFDVDLMFGPGSDFVKNGANALALYAGDTAADYLSGSQTTPLANGDLVDVVIHRVGASEDASLAATFGIVDQPDESENFDSENESIQRIPDGGTAFLSTDPTARSTNTPLPRIQVLPSPNQVNEDGGVGASIVTLTREGDVSESLSVEITIFPFEPSLISVPGTAFFAANESTTTFSIDTFSNENTDGDFIFELTVSESSGGPGGPGGPETNYQPGTASLVLKDDEGPTPTLVMNEILRSGEGGQGAEFIEIYNSSDLEVISNYVVVFFGADPDKDFGEQLLVVPIPSGSVNEGEFFTIGNSAVSSVYGVTPDLEISNLDLPNGDVTVVLFDSGGNPKFSVLMQDGELDAVPNTGGVPLAADILVAQDEGGNPAGYFLTTNGGELAQILESVGPSVQADSATPDAPNVDSPTLYLTRDMELIDEDDPGVVTFTVTRVPDTVGNLTVSIGNSDNTEVVVPGSVIIPDGKSSITFAGVPQTDGVRDGIKAASIQVSSSGFESDTSQVAILDSDVPDLGPCDIAFVASISDGPNEVFAFVTLTEIFSGTRITLTDRGWKAAGGFRAGEGEMNWLAITDVPAGTVVTFTDNTPDVGTANSGDLNLSDSGDQIFAYQGSSSSPTLIAGIHMNGAWDADATDVHTSALPPVLASGGAVAIDPEQNNAVYTGPTSGSIGLLKFFLFSNTNFSSGNNSSTVGAGLIPSSFVTNVAYEVVLGERSLSDEMVSISFTATGLSDVYVSSNLENWSLANGGENLASGSYSDSEPPAGKAFYMIQEADAPAP